MAWKVLFFDAAGTLIQPAEPVGLTYSKIAGYHGVKAGGEDLSLAFRTAWKALPPPEHPPGMPPADDDRGWWRRLVAQTFEIALGRPLAETVIAPLFDELYGHYSSREAWEVFADVVPTLQELEKDHRLIVLSNFDRRLHAILEGHDLLRYFGRVIISSEVGASKPEQRMFQEALAAAGCAAADCLHIGDDLKCDGEGAQEAGMGFFHVQRPGRGLDALVQKVRAGAHSGLRMSLR